MAKERISTLKQVKSIPGIFAIIKRQELVTSCANKFIENPLHNFNLIKGTYWYANGDIYEG